jgi:hypothetical protein
MGDRALIQVFSSDNYGDTLSPVLYLHWGGPAAPDIIEATFRQMKDRPDDVEYFFARLVENACATDPGGDMSIGVYNQTELLTKTDSQGDAGVFLVNVKRNTVSVSGGYKPTIPIGSVATWDYKK